jgi:spore germination protein GerM
MSGPDDNYPEGGPKFESDGELASKGALRARHFAVIVIVAVVIGAILYLWHRSTRVGPVSEKPEGVTVVPEGSRTVTLYFAEKDSEALTPETRLVAIGTDFVDQVKQVVQALTGGPKESGVSTIPEGTRLLDAFYDAETATVYLDFSSEIVAGHPGGSSAEYYTIAAIVRTVSENFPEVQAVQILVEGRQVGTIAGHIDAYQPFRVRDWR